MTAAQLATSSEQRQPEKENMTEFIAKKREIFLVQMSLDTKRAEITKLEERALQVWQSVCFLQISFRLNLQMQGYYENAQFKIYKSIGKFVSHAPMPCCCAVPRVF